MVTAEYILFLKYSSFISSNESFPDFIIFLSIYSYLWRALNSLNSEDEKESLAQSTVAQTRNLFSSAVILSSGFMLVAFISHRLYKAGSFMLGRSASITSPIGQKDDGSDNE